MHSVYLPCRWYSFETHELPATRHARSTCYKYLDRTMGISIDYAASSTDNLQACEILPNINHLYHLIFVDLTVSSNYISSRLHFMTLKIPLNLSRVSLMRYGDFQKPFLNEKFCIKTSIRFSIFWHLSINKYDQISNIH